VLCGKEIAMEVTGLLMDSLRLMVVGMAIVFAFLLLLVGVMKAMSTAVMRLTPQLQVGAADKRRLPAEAEDGELIAIITAAVARFRRDRR